MYYENGQIKKSQQQKVDERMCKPGYTWLDMPWTEKGGKCVGGYAGDGPPKVDKPTDPMPAPPPPTDGTQPGDGAVAKEMAVRKAVK